MSPPDPKRRRRPTGQVGAQVVNQHNSSGALNKPKRAGAQAAKLISDVRFRRRVQHLERLGNRVVGELLAKLAAEHDCAVEIERFIDAAIEHEDAIKAFGFDRWPPLPMRIVR